MPTTNTALSEPKTEHAKLRDIKDDAAAVKDDLATLAGDAKDCAVGVASAGADTARKGAESMMNTASDIAERTRSAHDQACGYVRRNPTTAVLLAVGVGAVLGRVLARR